MALGAGGGRAGAGGREQETPQAAVRPSAERSAVGRPAAGAVSAAAGARGSGWRRRGRPAGEDPLSHLPRRRPALRLRGRGLGRAVPAATRVAPGPAGGRGGFGARHRGPAVPTGSSVVREPPRSRAAAPGREAGLAGLRERGAFRGELRGGSGELRVGGEKKSVLGNGFLICFI